MAAVQAPGFFERMAMGTAKSAESSESAGSVATAPPETAGSIAFASSGPPAPSGCGSSVNTAG